MTDAKVSSFTTRAANICTFTYAYVTANGTYGKVAINSSAGLAIYTAGVFASYSDNTVPLGNNTIRWSGLVLGAAQAVAWSDGTHQNTQKYIDGTGPQFLDRTTTFKLTFNVQSLLADRTATWQDSSGTVAWLSSISDAPVITDIDGLALISITDFECSYYTWIMTGSGTKAAFIYQLEDGARNGDILWITNVVAITALTLTGTFSASVGLATPTTLPAGTKLAYVWNTDGWVRFQ